MPRRVSFVTLALAHYRRRFHELARDFLAAEGIHFDLIYSDPLPARFSKSDAIELPWAKKVKVYPLQIGSQGAYWQSAIGAVAGSDLVVVGQENKLLFNYWAHLN